MKLHIIQNGLNAFKWRTIKMGDELTVVPENPITKKDIVDEVNHPEICEQDFLLSETGIETSGLKQYKITINQNTEKEQIENIVLRLEFEERTLDSFYDILNDVIALNHIILNKEVQVVKFQVNETSSTEEVENAFDHFQKVITDHFPIK